jgi:hypothetical protein
MDKIINAIVVVVQKRVERADRKKNCPHHSQGRYAHKISKT